LTRRIPILEPDYAAAPQVDGREYVELGHFT
jgi:hypothetical protein